MSLIVAIDGPSGVGKTTTSKRVARELGIPHIDTGAMYRAIALKAIECGVAFDDDTGLEKLAAASHIGFRLEDDQPQTILDGRNVSLLIRTDDISMAASAVSAVPAVRRVLVRLQQEMGRSEGGVLEGRDIGTKVFPETPHKFFLTARPDVRAERRQKELLAKGTEVTFSEVRAGMEQRDTQDSTRADSPLRCDDSYTAIDTSGMSVAEVVDVIVRKVRESSSVS